MKMPSVALLFASILALFTATTSSVAAGPKADLVVVEKSQRTLHLIHQGTPFRTYRVALGPQPWGHKERAGDDRTPEGWYILDMKKADSEFYRAIRISYPNLLDRARAEAAGVDPGGAIMIHGQPAKSDQPPELAQLFNWTSGCIAVTNPEMDEIWAAVDVGTPIHIKP